jgi:pepF/M3 family oligoendopeptidase
MDTTAPHWDLSNVYPGLDSSNFKSALSEVQRQIDDMEAFFSRNIANSGPQTAASELAASAGQLIKRFNALAELAWTVEAYIGSFVATDSYNQQAKRLESEFDMQTVRVRKLGVQAQAWIGRIAASIPEVLRLDATAAEHAFYLQENATQSKYLMSQAEESLAAELSLSSTNLWGKLQGTITSQLSVDFELDGKPQKLPMPALINLRSHPDETVRRRAYEAELLAWESVKEPLAAAMNGIKGTVNTLNSHRGRTDALHASIDAARIDRPTLEALLSAVEDSFPMFRRYFIAKARKLGKERLAWWDLFAPLGKTDTTYSWEQTRAFILENFAAFAPELADLARRAFDRGWIDAEMRSGKRGGAFCMPVPAVRESRVLCNFDGSLDQVSTIAHELGHAFHNHCAFAAGKTMLQQDTPMTLAETASIMCETIISQAVLRQAGSAAERLAVLEIALNNASQVSVDIYSRYLFEKEVFERRSTAELSADELCDIMERAQRATYGDGLDERFLQKFMWTWKPHYYSAGLSFYNYPYTFGLLFGTGLYAIYQRKGAAFVPDYINLLASTGEASAADLADRFGIDIRTKQFWAGSLAIIGQQIEQYERL